MLLFIIIIDMKFINILFILRIYLLGRVLRLKGMWNGSLVRLCFHPGIGIQGCMV